MRSLSSSMTKRLLQSARHDHASGDLLQCGGTRDGRGELPSVLRSRPWRVAGGKAVKHLSKALFGQILVGVLPDHDHGRVHAGAKAFNLFPAEIAVPREVERIAMNATLANVDEVACATQPAWRCPADLHVGLFAHRPQLKHSIKGRDLKHADVRHLEQIG